MANQKTYRCWGWSILFGVGVEGASFSQSCEDTSQFRPIKNKSAIHARQDAPPSLPSIKLGSLKCCFCKYYLTSLHVPFTTGQWYCWPTELYPNFLKQSGQQRATYLKSRLLNHVLPCSTVSLNFSSAPHHFGIRASFPLSEVAGELQHGKRSSLCNPPLPGTLYHLSIRFLNTGWRLILSMSKRVNNAYVLCCFFRIYQTHEKN